MSFIPVKCPDCGGPISRISNYNPGVMCVECDSKFRLVKVSKK